MVSLFCRHNRFTADCPICSRGTVLETGGAAGSKGAERAPSRDPARSGSEGRDPGAQRTKAARAEGRGDRPPAFRGRYAAAGPYERDGRACDVRLERVPGGLRLAEWSGAGLEARAPVLAPSDLPALVEAAGEAGALEPDEHARLASAVDESDAPAARLKDETAEPDGGAAAVAHGASPGHSGELRDELRVERLDPERVRIARWVLRPGTGWELLDAPTMLPAHRYAEALADASRRGLLSR